MADVFGLGSQVQKWITAVLLPQIQTINDKIDSTLEAVTKLRDDLSLHERLQTVEQQMQHFRNKEAARKSMG